MRQSLRAGAIGTVLVFSSLAVQSIDALAQGRPPIAPPGRPIGPTPQPPVVVVPSPPPTPPKKQISRREVERVARDSARYYADLRLDTYAVAGQIRYNVREGILDERSRLGDFDRFDEIRRSGDYSVSLRQAQTEAVRAGEQAGERAAQFAARYKADADINRSIDTAIETGRQIVFQPDPSPAPYSGDSNPLTAPTGVSAVMSSASEEAKTQREMRGLLTRSPARYFLDSYWDMDRILARHDLSIPQEADSSDNFEDWRRDSSRDQQIVYGQRFFRDVTSPDYLDPVNNGRVFRAAFDAEYDRHIRSQWRQVVERYNRAAISIGNDAYSRAAAEVARQLGRFDGYAEGYTRASLDGYRMSFGGFYSAQYERIKDRVLNSAYITRAQIRVASYNSGSTEVSAGDFINVTVERLANRGRLSGVASVQAVSSATITPLRTDEIRMAGFSQLAQPSTHLYLAQVSDVTAPDQNITLQVQVGEEVFSVSLRATFEELVKRIGQIKGNEPFVRRLAEKASEFVREQYADQSGFSDQYANRRADMLLVRMLKVFEQLPESEKAQIRSYGQLFRNAFGSKPVRLDAKRNDWEEANQMMKEMGLEGQAPPR